MINKSRGTAIDRALRPSATSGPGKVGHEAGSIAFWRIESVR